MNKKILPLILVFVLLVSSLKGQPPTDWGTDESWTEENVRAHPEEAFNANPDKAVATWEGILENDEFASRFFTGAAVGTRIKEHSEKATQYFEKPGNLKGDGGEAYVEYKSGGNVDFQYSGGNVEIKGNSLSNLKGAPIQDLSQYPAGTIIMPNGDNGFKIILPGGKAIAIAGGNELTPIDYNLEKGIEVANAANNRFDIVIGEGDIAKKLRFSGGKGFELNGDSINIHSGDVVGIGLGGEFREVKSYGDSSILFAGEGYKIQGDFYHSFNTKIGRVEVPTFLEAIGKEKGVIVEKKVITLCVLCGEKIEEDGAVVWDGDKLNAYGKVSLSLEKENGEAIHSAGLIDGMGYSLDVGSINIVKVPSVEQLSNNLIVEIEKKKGEYRERGKEINKEIAELEKEKSKNKRQIELLKKTDKIIDVKIGELPFKYSENKFNELSRDTSFVKSDYYEFIASDNNKYYYGIADLNKYDVKLVAISNIKEKTVYASLMTTNLEKGREYDIAVNKISFFSDSIAGTEKNEPINFDFKVDGNTKGRLTNNKFYGPGDKEMDFYTDILIKTKKEKETDPDISLTGYVDTMLSDLTPTGGKGAVKAQLEGKNLDLLSVKINKEERTILFRNDLDSQSGIINLASDVSEAGKIILRVGGWFKGEGTLAGTIEHTIADHIKAQVYLTRESDLDAISGPMDRLAGVISPATVNSMKEGIKEVVEELRQSPELDKMVRYKGIEVEIKQLNENEAQIAFKISGSGGDINVGPIAINTDGKDIIEEAANQLEKFNQQRGLTTTAMASDSLEVAMK